MFFQKEIRSNSWSFGLRALMSFLVAAEADKSMSKEEVRNFNAFDSAKKYSSVTLVHDGKCLTYIKGAPEKIIDKCTHYVDENGNVKELVEKNYLTAYIDTQAGRSMRLLAVAKAEGDSDDAALTSAEMAEKSDEELKLVGALYITFICLGILFVQPIHNLFGNVDLVYLKSAVFAVFMMANTFNGFNARTSHIYPFEGLGRNKTFIWVMLSVFALQFVFVTFGGEVLSVESLSVTGWLTCIALSFLVIPIDMIRKMIMHKAK